MLKPKTRRPENGACLSAAASAMTARGYSTSSVATAISKAPASTAECRPQRLLVKITPFPTEAKHNLLEAEHPLPSPPVEQGAPMPGSDVASEAEHPLYRTRPGVIHLS